jgi:sodium/bile acid cotransporter 7
MGLLRRFDPFTLALVATIALASLLPVSGDAAAVMRTVTNVAIGIMFFLYGARLSRQAVVEGMAHWRLHLTVFASTYVLFPILGVVLSLVTPSLLPRELAVGVLFLTTLPSTVQSSIAFTSIAGGNVAAAICSASISNLAGILVTPLLVGLVMQGTGAVGFSLHAVETIALQLFLPFVLGQVLQPWLGGWALRHKTTLGLTDRGSILLVVYLAFSEAISQGLWETLAPLDLVVLLGVSALLLTAVLVITTLVARRAGFSREDEITIVFCGSKKSLATGVPIANVLFAGGPVGSIVLPLMVFHQLQLMVCAALARRYAARGRTTPNDSLGSAP